jgi:hypothetical protein
MNTDNLVDFPGSTLAYREYEAQLSDELRVSLAFTLCDLDADTMAAHFAQERNAVAFGLISIDMPDGPDHPILWMVDDTHLSLATEEGASPMSDELQNIVELYLRLFFIQVVPIAPHLASLEWGQPAVNENATMH